MQQGSRLGIANCKILESNLKDLGNIAAFGGQLSSTLVMTGCVKVRDSEHK